MSLTNRVFAIPLESLNSADFDGTYVSFPPLPEPCFLIRIVNNSDIAITISYNGGTTTHDVLFSNSTTTNVLEINAQTNSQPNAKVALFPAGMVIAVNGVEGTGDVYLAGYYQPKGLS